MTGETQRVHATCVVLGGVGIAIRGKPGSGKSDLALRLIENGGGLNGGDRADALLVSDDYSDMTRRAGQIYAAPPLELAGRIEVRGLGIVRLLHAEETRIDLVIDLVGRKEIERLPDRDSNRVELAGVSLPRLFLHAFDISALAKIKAAIGTLVTGVFDLEDDGAAGR